MRRTLALPLLLAACNSEVAPHVPSEAAPTPPVAAVDVPKDPAAAPEAAMTQETNLYAIDAQALDGSDGKLSQYKGKVALVVNVASECGFTPQYAGLEKLWQEYKDKGLVVLGFPSNEFGGQEPGDAAAIQAFCTKNYGVTFPLFAKVEVKKGPGQSPVYQYLTSAAGAQPGWNFCKYLVSKNGRVLKFWKSQTTPESAELRGAVDAALASK
jgi:glutathione peroxidase